MLKTGEMLIMLIMVILLFNQKVLKTGDMLIMQIMVNLLGTYGGREGALQKGQKINMINISPVLSTFRAKSA